MLSFFLKSLRNTHTSENVEFWRLRRPGEQQEQNAGHALPGCERARERKASTLVAITTAAARAFYLSLSLTLSLFISLFGDEVLFALYAVSRTL